MKFHFKRVVGSLTLTYEELETVSCQVEACLNSRPIIAHTSHVTDAILTLTSGHFLIGKTMVAYSETLIPSLLKRWNRCQAMVQHFLARWSKEYLQTLQAKGKWRAIQPNLQVGDVVILKEDKTFACYWPLAKVLQTYPGKDGLVRVAKIKTATSELKRPVTKLSLLHREEADQDSTPLALPGGLCPDKNSGHCLSDDPAQDLQLLQDSSL